MQNKLFGFVIPFVLFFTSCSSKVHYLDELDLTVLENSKHLSEDALLSYLQGKYLIIGDSSWQKYQVFNFSPVFICGIPCWLSASGRITEKSKSIDSWTIESRFEYLDQVGDSIKQRGDEFPTHFGSKKALQDSLLTRLKRKYGDWNHWIPDTGGLYKLSPDVKLRTISVIVRPRLHSRWPLDTSTSISLYDSADYSRWR